MPAKSFGVLGAPAKQASASGTNRGERDEASFVARLRTEAGLEQSVRCVSRRTGARGFQLRPPTASIHAIVGELKLEPSDLRRLGFSSADEAGTPEAIRAAAERIAVVATARA